MWLYLDWYIGCFVDVPDSPGKPDIAEVTKDTATLTWTPPEKDGGSPVINYIIEYKPTRASKWISASHNITVVDTTFKVKDLTEGMEYEFRVLAENKAGVSKPSAPTKVVVKEPVSKSLNHYCLRQKTTCQASNVSLSISVK